MNPLGGQSHHNSYFEPTPGSAGSSHLPRFSLQRTSSFDSVHEDDSLTPRGNFEVNRTNGYNSDAEYETDSDETSSIDSTSSRDPTHRGTSPLPTPRGDQGTNTDNRRTPEQRNGSTSPMPPAPRDSGTNPMPTPTPANSETDRVNPPSPREPSEGGQEEERLARIRARLGKEITRTPFYHFKANVQYYGEIAYGSSGSLQFSGYANPVEGNHPLYEMSQAVEDIRQERLFANKSNWTYEVKARAIEETPDNKQRLFDVGTYMFSYPQKAKRLFLKVVSLGLINKKEHRYQTQLYHGTNRFYAKDSGYSYAPSGKKLPSKAKVSESLIPILQLLASNPSLYERACTLDPYRQADDPRDQKIALALRTLATEMGRPECSSPSRKACQALDSALHQNTQAPVTFNHHVERCYNILMKGQLEDSGARLIQLRENPDSERYFALPKEVKAIYFADMTQARPLPISFMRLSDDTWVTAQNGAQAVESSENTQKYLFELLRTEGYEPLYCLEDPREFRASTKAKAMPTIETSPKFHYKWDHTGQLKESYSDKPLVDPQHDDLPPSLQDHFSPKNFRQNPTPQKRDKKGHYRLEQRIPVSAKHPTAQEQDQQGRSQAAQTHEGGGSTRIPTLPSPPQGWNEDRVQALS